MSWFDTRRWRSVQVMLAGLMFAGLAACASYRPVPLEELSFTERVETQTEGGLVVSVAVLSREEARQAFGVNLQKRGIQPVWLEIENQTDKDFWFMMAGVDPNYFSAHEAAYMNHFRFGGQANKQMDNYFSDVGLDRLLRSGEKNSGFVFSNETVGTKEVRARLYSDQDLRTFSFFVSVPGILSEWDSKDLKVIADQSKTNIDNEEDLRAALQALPCCTQKADGSGAGDPLNLVVIGGVSTLRAFITAGWDEAVFRQDFRSVFGAAFLYGRLPDVQFQKSRRRVESVNLVQLWISPIRYRGELVLVGSVGRNIDPNVDEAVLYVVEDLATAEVVGRFGKVGGVAAVSRDKPQKNFANAPYWTMGGRAVLEMTEQPVKLSDIKFFDWDWNRKIQRAVDD